MNDPQGLLDDLLTIYRKLLAAPLLPKGSEWKGEWPGWIPGESWYPEASGVYILWDTADGHESGRAPVYVGEGHFGRRVGAAFHRTTAWTHAQMLPNPYPPGHPASATLWRKALERFAILALNPRENRG